MDESDLIFEFMKISKCNKQDAISCLAAWNNDLKRALIDYNDTSTRNYFRNKTKTKTEESDDDFLVDLKTSMEPSSANGHDRDKSKLTGSHRPLLTKSDSIDVECKKLGRGISRANDENVDLVTKARKELGMDFHAKQEISSPFIDTPDYTFTLPNLSKHDDDFRKFLERDLIECSTLNSLENSQRLNWWSEGVCRKLWPLSTSGDGNCLLHAASLAMWGFHDRRLTLRKALYNILSQGDLRSTLWRRWRFQQTRINLEAGLVLCETEWAREWDEIVNLAEAKPRNNKNGGVRRRSIVLEKQSSLCLAEPIDGNATYDSLEEIHVLALAYVLRRPIIVISDIVLRDINGDALAPVTFGGVYLPLDIPQEKCHKVPLLLAYDTAHFSPLVTMETSNEAPVSTYPSENSPREVPALIPLIDFENCLLPIQFPLDPGENFSWKDYDGREGDWALTEVEHIALLKEYFEISYASPAESPELTESEIYEDYEDDEYDKKMLDIAINLNNEENHISPSGVSSELDGNPKPNQPKSKSVKLQNVAKQFGSIGRSMSKKIKKNIGSIAKFGRSSGNLKLNNSSLPTLGGGYVNGKYRLLCCQLKVKRHDYQDEMIKNYLDCAYERFIQELRKTALKETDSSSSRIVHCINTDCDNFGSEKNSWMCEKCYESQRARETSQIDYEYQPPRYGTGNSKFYTQSDTKSHDSVCRLPSVKKLNDDQTLYLYKSTFFDDSKPSHLNFNKTPSPLSPNTSYGKTTIIPIKVEGQDETDLIQLNVSPERIKLKEKENGLAVDGKCRNPGCKFFGNSTGFCSKCNQEKKLPVQQYRKITDI